MRFKKYKPALLLADIIVLFVPIIISYWLKYRMLLAVGNRYIHPPILLPYTILIISMLVIFKNSHLYKMQKLFDSYYQFMVFVKSILIGYGILITTLFFLKHPLLDERSIIIPSFIILFLMLPIYRIVILKRLLSLALRKKIIGERVVLIGADNKGQEISEQLINNKYAYFTPVGFFDDKKEVGAMIGSLKVMDKIKNLWKYYDDFDEILIALTDVSYNELQTIINICQKLNKPIHIISDLYRIVQEKVEVEKFDGFRTFQVPIMTGFQQFPYIIFKRFLDYFVSLLIILLFLPVWILIAVLIKRQSAGPVLFKAKGIGYNERPFVWYKFRSMYQNTDDTIHKKLIEDMAKGIKTDGEKLKDDLRITQSGKWLRKYSIDEFPQLLNVLKGDMSLVGPRPVLPYEFELMDDWQKEILTVLPGMTGLWQVRGRNQVKFEDQYVLDLYYVRNRSIWIDIEILFNTISVVLSGKSGA
jgi:undecaprenyl-phosphate galactose phosphotransferase